MTCTTAMPMTPLPPSEHAAFKDAVIMAIENKELVAEFNRLYGANIGAADARSPIEKAIDEAAGHDPQRQPEAEKDMLAFVHFFHEYIWLRVIERQHAIA